MSQAVNARAADPGQGAGALRMVCCRPRLETALMIELDFYGYDALHGNVLGECLDAAGIDASLHGRSGSPAHDVATAVDQD
jgi:hypothetical protein